MVAGDVGPELGFAWASEQMYAAIEQDVRADIGGNSQRIDDVSTTFDGESCALLLLPAWLVSYRHGTRDWSALVNGASGEVAGQRPYSTVKIALTVGVLALVATVMILVSSR